MIDTNHAVSLAIYGRNFTKFRGFVGTLRSFLFCFLFVNSMLFSEDIPAYVCCKTVQNS